MCAAAIKRNPLDGDAGIPLAMSYVKDQSFGETYDPVRGLSVGTIFPELNKPFTGSAFCSGRRA